MDVRKKSRTSSANVTPNRRKSPSLRLDIPETCGLTQVIPLPGRDAVPARRPPPRQDSQVFLLYSSQGFFPTIKGSAAPRPLSKGQRPLTQYRPPLSDRNSLKNELNVMKDRSLCQAKKATRYKRRIKLVLEDNDCQMKSCIIPKIHQSMITGSKSQALINRNSVRSHGSSSR